MPKAPKFYVPCPHCGWYGPGTFKMVPKPGMEKADPNDGSHWHQVCTHCGKEVNQKETVDKFKASGGKYTLLGDEVR